MNALRVALFRNISKKLIRIILYIVKNANRIVYLAPIGMINVLVAIKDFFL